MQVAIRGFGDHLLQPLHEINPLVVKPVEENITKVRSPCRIYILYMAGSEKRAVELSALTVVAPAVEFVRVLFPCHVEIQTQVSIYAQSKVIVHDIDLWCVLVSVCTNSVVLQLSFLLINLFLIRVEYHCPSAVRFQEKLFNTVPLLEFITHTPGSYVITDNRFICLLVDSKPSRLPLATTYLSNLIDSASITSLSSSSGASGSPPLEYPGPQRNTRAKSLPGKKQMLVTSIQPTSHSLPVSGTLWMLSCWPTSSVNPVRFFAYTNPQW